MIYAVVALAALSGGTWLGVSRFSGPIQPTAAEVLQTLKLPDFDGKTQALSQWKGKVLVVNFWATWCAPCREEIPVFVGLQHELGVKGLQFVGISIDQADKTREFATTFKINYPTLIGTFDTLEEIGRADV